MPPGHSQTKPRACNVGLALAGGDVVVVFDGEDRPDPGQPRKAAAALAADTRLAVVQARLGCDHAGPGSPVVTERADAADVDCVAEGSVLVFRPTCDWSSSSKATARVGTLKSSCAASMER